MSNNGQQKVVTAVAETLGDELAGVQTPEGLARASVASAERLLGRPVSRHEISEYSSWYERVVAEFAKISKERA